MQRSRDERDGKDFPGKSSGRWRGVRQSTEWWGPQGCRVGNIGDTDSCSINTKATGVSRLFGGGSMRGVLTKRKERENRR